MSHIFDNINQDHKYEQTHSLIRNRIPVYWAGDRIFYQDDFERTTLVNWIQSTGTVTLATDVAFRGDKALKLTTGALAGNDATAAKLWGVFSTLRRIGLEFKWYTTASLANLRTFNIYIDVYDGTNRYRCQLSYQGTVGAAQEKWQYINSAGNLTDITGGAQSHEQDMWNTFKAVIDPTPVIRKYIYMVTNEKAFPLELALYGSASASSPKLSVTFAITTETNNIINAWIDDLLITAEP